MNDKTMCKRVSKTEIYLGLNDLLKILAYYTTEDISEGI